MPGNKISNIAKKTAEEAADTNKVSSLYCKNNINSDKFDKNCPACSLLLNAAGALVEFWSDKQVKHTKDS